MRVEFELGKRWYAVSRGRHGAIEVEVNVPEHIDDGKRLNTPKPECWRPLNPRRFPRAVGRIISVAKERGLLA